MTIVPDEKDWTWVLQRTCDECGFAASSVDVADVGDRVRAIAAEWPALLGRADAARRPFPHQWSAVEYGCHVRDVFRLHTYRLGLIVDQDGPEFPNWDQDETAVIERYAEQDPDTVAWELLVAAAENADLWDAVTPVQHARTGFRSDGAAFTVDSFARYFVHDAVHHLADVVRGNRILDAQRRS